MADAIIIDYGIGNLKSVQRGIIAVGGSAHISSSPEEILSANRLILPGVGAFGKGMEGLNCAGLVPVMKTYVESGRPLLGICLGMQMLMDYSEEFGITKGLGFIPGKVVEIPKQHVDGSYRKIPHIGWSALERPAGLNSWSDTLMKRIIAGDFFYFVHSFMAVPDSPSYILAQCEYESMQVTAAIRRDNVTGLQFHPEKSGSVGLKILEEFIHG